MAQPLNYYNLTALMSDIGTATQARFQVPAPGFLRKVGCSITAALTGADAVLTVSHNNTALSPTITVTQSGSAEGDFDSAEYYRGVAEGDWIEVTSDGGPSNAVTATITITLSR